MENFSSLGLSELLMRALERVNFTKPTPVQAMTIPLALEGKDILGSAQTGTGKTAAFGIPLIEYLLKNEESSALVIAPTRELAAQIIKTLHDLLPKEWFKKTSLLIGGESIIKQLRQLKMNPKILVGTPGRIIDHLERGSLSLKKTEFLVLDETDRMLDMGFTIQIDQIVKHLPKKRQTLLFSATMPKNIISAAERYLINPVRVAIDVDVLVAPKIKQDVVHVSEKEKYQTLLTELDSREGSVIIFVKTKRGADQLSNDLRKDRYLADAIHGDLRHSRRERVIKSFRGSKFRILVATDIAARGLDIPHIEHVVNYDLPQCPEDYIHRIGRTARAGNQGSALCFVSPRDKGKWIAIENILNPGAKKPQQDFKQERFGNKKRFNPSQSRGRKKVFAKR